MTMFKVTHLKPINSEKKSCLSKHINTPNFFCSPYPIHNTYCSRKLIVEKKTKKKQHSVLPNYCYCFLHEKIKPKNYCLLLGKFSNKKYFLLVSYKIIEKKKYYVMFLACVLCLSHDYIIIFTQVKRRQLIFRIFFLFISNDTTWKTNLYMYVKNNNNHIEKQLNLSISLKKILRAM